MTIRFMTTHAKLAKLDGSFVKKCLICGRCYHGEPGNFYLHRIEGTSPLLIGPNKKGAYFCFHCPSELINDNSCLRIM